MPYKREFKKADVVLFVARDTRSWLGEQMQISHNAHEFDINCY